MSDGELAFLSPTELAELRDAFLEEGAELLAQMESALLELERQPLDAGPVNEAFRAAHTFKGNAAAMGLQAVAAAAHEMETALAPAREHPGALAPEDIAALLEALDALRGLVLAPQAPAGGAAGEAGAPPGTAPGESSLRVKQARVDRVVDLVGELVTSRNELQHLQGLVDGDPRLAHLARRMKSTTADVNRIVNRLQDDVLGLRMVPMRAVFQRLPRIVHDLAAREGKLVDHAASGADTEVDKGIADALADPLMHLVRNALDHGLEDPATRRAAGKPVRARVSWSARREGNRLEIEVCDDGRGLDPARLRRGAVARGILDEATARGQSDEDALALAFAPGVSTAASVSDVSGRGVGLDVVASAVRRLGGTFEVRSQPGRGATFTLSVPLKLSLFRGLVFRAAGDEQFVLPLDAVAETLHLEPTQVGRVGGRAVTTVRGRLLGLVSLAEVLGRAGHGPGGEREVLVVEAGAEKAGLLVESVEAPQDVMVRPLAEYLCGAGIVCGATVMGDGRVALVLDPAALLRFNPRTAAGTAR